MLPLAGRTGAMFGGMQRYRVGMGAEQQQHHGVGLGIDERDEGLGASEDGGWRTAGSNQIAMENFS